MSVRVRFAPSPTGYLHVGGARTALYCYLFAKAQNGRFILRVEDTDTERSTREYEQSQIEDLKWLGLEWDEGPDLPNKFGPYRQSERLDIYQKMAQKLLKNKKAFYCFCSDEELKLKKEKFEAANLPPVYDGTCRTLTDEEVIKQLNGGKKATIRFIAPQKDYEFHDLVRGDVHFPAGMVGDFVILRSDGTAVYNYCCVVDDSLMEMTHVIRAEEHLPNTLRQLMLYEAYEVTPPVFAHVSLLVGADRQKLSKRHGATSLRSFREQWYSPAAIINYLALLGWSHPEEKNIFTIDELISVFDLNRFNKAPAVFDYQKFKWVNGQHLKLTSNEKLIQSLESFLPSDNLFHQQNSSWKINFTTFFKEHSETLQELGSYVDEVLRVNVELNSELQDVISWETTPKILNYLQSKVNELSEENEFCDEVLFELWGQELKLKEKIKGKFLFMGMRCCLTGMAHGKDLKSILPLTPMKLIKSRLAQLEEIVHGK